MVCGTKGTKSCSRCLQSRYCSRAHQVVDWSLGQHRQVCASGGASSGGTSSGGGDGASSESLKEQGDEILRTTYLFKEFEIVSEPEPAKSKAAKYDKLEADVLDDEETAMTTTAKEEYEEAVSSVDKAFLRFQKRIERAPSQVLRFISPSLLSYLLTREQLCR